MLGVGSMIGGGIFNSPTDLINVSNPQTTLIAWGIGGAGIIFLALVFQMLAEKRSELTGGIFNYAYKGFGEFIGFNSAWGYWMSAWIGNVALYTLMFKTIDDLFGGVNPLLSFALASAFHWGIFYIQTKGAKEAGIINAIVNLTKFIPVILVIGLGIFAFSVDIFNVDNWRNVLASKAGTTQAATTVLSQIKNSMGTILWCFVGIEAAVVLSEKAKSQKIVGKATVISIIIALSTYVAVSVIGMGVVPANELATATTPFAMILEKTALGDLGGIIVKLGLILALSGASISWLMVTSEIPYIVAKEGLMPKWFTKQNKKGVPINALFMTTLCMQTLLFALLLPQLQSAYRMLSTIATSTILVPYLLSSLYALKVCKEDKLSTKYFIIAIVASLYSFYVLYAVGVMYLGLSMIIYAMGIGVYIKAKKENAHAITKKEKIGMALMIVIAILMVVMIAMGLITV